MKIVYLHQYFKTPDMPGGTRSYEMAKRFVGAGHEVHVITSTTHLGARGWTVEDIGGIHVHWLNLDYDNRMSFRRRILAFVVFAIRSAWLSRRLRGDVVFATSTPLTVAIPGILATFGTRTRMVFEVRDLWPRVPIALGALSNTAMQRLAYWLERLAYRRSAHVVALSPGMAQGVHESCPTVPVTVIPNAADRHLFSVDADIGRDFRSSRPWLGDRPLVVYTGTLGMVNGVAYMAKLAAECRALDASVRFLVVGDGAELEAVRDEAEGLGVLNETFFMEPPVSKSEVPAILSAADVAASWVIPVQELEANSANKFFDALAAGRPVAINHQGWLADYIRESRVGVVLHPLDMRLAAKQLVDFLVDPAAVSAARDSANRLAASAFDRDLLATRLLEILADPAARTPMPSQTKDAS